MNLQKGELVRVVAGKYKGLVMSVVGFEETSVFVSDGRHRKLEKTKKLNVKHVVSFGARLEKEVPTEYTNKSLYREIQQNVRLDERKD